MRTETTTTTTLPPPPSSASTTTFKKNIPPPPPSSAAFKKTLTAPPPSSDFRTAVIKNHWNDPPKKIFSKETTDVNDELNKQEILKILKNKLELCKTSFKNGPQKRIVDDTIRRLDVLLKELENELLSNEVVQSVYALSKGLESKEYTKALEVHTKLMTTQYESHGNWIVGLKRLIDLTEKAYM
ncbi:MAG: hypothetical protein EXX96DRAFT_577318 [Benjaminiella poitrasii]|nr:MAG: hypothetical protein EXX96DRAFT_577318 [Benjaminiella poitrasii]